MALSPLTKLQSVCFHPDVTASQVVRAAIVLASALQDQQALSKFRKELAGYEPSVGETHPPSHRLVHCRLMANDKYGRRVPVFFPSAKSQDHYGTVPVIQGLGGLEVLLKGANPGGEFEVEFNPEAHESLLQAMPDAVRVFRAVQTAQFSIVLEVARQAVFDWCTDKLGQGVECPAGLSIDAMLPTPPIAAAEERITPALLAPAGLSINASNSSVIVQSPSASSTVTQRTEVDSAAVKALTDLLEAEVASHAHLSSDPKLSELRQQLLELKALMSIEKPRTAWVLESVKSARAVLENAAGSVLATVATRPEIVAAFQRLLG